MENQEMNNEKSLAIIAEMLSTTRNNISEDGFHFLLWGVILVACCLIQYVMITFMNMLEESNNVWLVMPLVGIPLSKWHGSKKAAKRKVKTFVDDYYKYIWLGFGISLFSTIFLCNVYDHSPNAFIMVITGFAVFMSGVILKFKPLIYGSFVFWLGSFGYYFMPSNSLQLLIFAVSVSLGYIIPGILLRKQFKGQSDVQTA